MILNINILSAIKYGMWYVKKSYKMRKNAENKIKYIR